MYLKKIHLTNIGPYRGMHTIDLSTSPEKNTVLIGGENGAGKTTLLNSIKMGLFGSFGFGYKTENKEYLKKVDSILNYSAKVNGENNFRLRLDFDLIDDLTKKEYSLYRAWKYQNKSVKETLDVLQDGKYLNDYEKEVFQSKLKEIMPPHLLDLCLFDGEEISRIINNNLLSSYIEKLTNVLFNLDLFEVMEKDLDIYSQQKENISSLNTQEKELISLREVKNNHVSTISSLNEQIERLSQSKNEVEEEYSRIKNDFEIHGGLIRDEREEIHSSINELENERKQNQERIKHFVSSMLPFFLARDLVMDTREQLINEEKFQLYSSLDEKLTQDKIRNILQQLSISSNNQDAEEILKNEILSTVKPSDETGLIHGASFSEGNQVENIFQEVSTQRLDLHITTIEENKTKLKEIQNLKSKLKLNDSSSEFSVMVSDMEKYNHQLNQLSQQIDAIEVKLHEEQVQLSKINNQIESIEHKFKDQEKSRNSFVESQKIISLSQKFRRIQLQKKLQEVQMEALRMLNKLMRKRNYIASIKIDPSSFEVYLFDQQNEAMEKSTLSAGEKEILLLSIIWAIFKCSGRNVPFIFDTLLGRLDRTHKQSILTHYIPNCGRQAIVLSTDSEIDEGTYSLLHEYTAKEYTLSFDVNKKETSILDNYFSFKGQEVNH
ncbi:DNA sulfur modification protein DndD [Rossellomorea marisflavi]|uniref:DNA sulfur modification protein DndD n=1 Tax=Rossellomorea marisflavi TaxID=189381 RepID=UPI00203CB7C1|nr:DNA sulfur modification protein DndD [Rossellomorea marisflavi]MCM2603454.1 DNA sulfur modification protein DndD [Rossellomorea marisflavi]